MTESDILDDILATEGWPKYTNRPNDKGGPTKGGITLKTLSAWRKKECSIEDLQALEEGQARAIYAYLFIYNPRFNFIADAALRLHVIDCGVNHGPERVTRWLQLIARVPEDGIFGGITQAALNGLDPRGVSVKLAAQRIRFYGQIIDGNYHARQKGLTTQDQSENAEGWLNRATKFLDRMSFPVPKD
jgi:lysozyme family protein